MESREERLKEKLCEKMSLFCSFSPFVMGKLFLRKVKFYLRNVIPPGRFPFQEHAQYYCEKDCHEEVRPKAENKDESEQLL
jgi:hypothetical protein